MAGDRKIIKQINLREPVQHGSETIDVVTVYKPRGKDMRVLLKGDQEEATMRFVSKCTLLEEAILDELDSDDWMEIVESVGELVERGRRTGLQG